VLAAGPLGVQTSDYDQLQDLAEQHNTATFAVNDWVLANWQDQRTSNWPPDSRQPLLVAAGQRCIKINHLPLARDNQLATQGIAAVAVGYPCVERTFFIPPIADPMTACASGNAGGAWQETHGLPAAQHQSAFVAKGHGISFASRLVRLPGACQCQGSDRLKPGYSRLLALRRPAASCPQLLVNSELPC